MWGATVPNRLTWQHWKISIHAPRVGSDKEVIMIMSKRSTFQSTLPVWGATITASSLLVGFHISIHAPRVGSDKHRKNNHFQREKISIHAPRVGSDLH